MAVAPENVPVLSISEFTALVKARLETDFASVWITGEISSLARPGSGHLYFNLKDSQAILRGVIWRGVAQRLRFQLQDGLEVIARGRLSVYPPRGDYQIVLEEVHPKGIGAQDLALRQLKEKLASLGYFDARRKKPIPRFPKRIVLVTSPTGAAVRDMLEILVRRWPTAEVWISPVRVQGELAGTEISAALERLNQCDGIDVVILGRGGGSTEDLFVFNDERIAHAIFRLKHPLISAVGHEIDVTIADLVADRRALTPSEAVELATPHHDELTQAFAQTGQRIASLLQQRVVIARQRLEDLATRRVFRFPLERIQQLERQLDEFDARMLRAMQTRVRSAEHQIQAKAAQLESLNPLNVLARGYSLTRTPEKRVVRSVGDVVIGAPLEVIVADGRLRVRVEGSSAHES